MNEAKYEDDESFWYYADGSGNIYAGEFKTIKGKKYAFKDDGRMIDGLHFIYANNARIYDESNVYLGTYEGLIVNDDDDSAHPFDEEDAFLESAIWYERNGYKSYYFGGGDDGAMRTNKTTVEIDGENHNFYFEKSGSNKGAGITGEKDDKLYMSGMLLKADSDDKYQVIVEQTTYAKDAGTNNIYKSTVYAKMDTDDFFNTVLQARDVDDETKSTSFGSVTTKKNKDLAEAYNLPDGKDTVNTDTRVNGVGIVTKYYLVNTSGKIIDSNTKSKDGNDYYIVTSKSKVLSAFMLRTNSLYD